VQLFIDFKYTSRTYLRRKSHQE